MSSPSPESEVHTYDSDEESIDVSRQMMDVLINSGIPDACPLLTELTPEQFPLHFSERGGRLFHSHHSSPYPLPVDTPEQEVLDYAAVLQEVGRVLRSNGLFVSYEWGRYPAFHPVMGFNPSEHAPGVCGFFDALTHALDVCRGIQPVAGTLPALLAEAGCYCNVTARLYYMPIGPWHGDPRMKELGQAFRATLVRYADSVKPLLIEAGWTEGQVAAIIAAYLHDLRTVSGLVAVLHTVHAQRI
ncbi:hypothetical protein C0993_011048 [Termitomyces sp. T159_Od127]|nr:hypothetical protein C0993_011048 [Termitomyces sp. T159_Od127]